MAASPLSDDEVLLQRYRAGSVEAFNELVLRHSRALFSYIRGMVGQQEEAEDIFQDTWTRVIRHEASFRGGTVRGWIWRIAKNAVIDRVRRRKPDDSLDRPIRSPPPACRSPIRWTATTSASGSPRAWRVCRPRSEKFF
jgi:DNA-directed RNA polymerase specialized sigma24 family protein